MTTIPIVRSPIARSGRATVDAAVERSRQKIAAGRLIFALDATASRQPTWNLAIELQSQMFSEAAKIGALEIQLVFFRGAELPKASHWNTDAQALAAKMRGITCKGGVTQWGRVLGHVRREHQQKPISAVVCIGDCCEEQPSALYDAAAGLPKLIVAQEGDDPAASVVFPELARRTGGAHLKLGPDSARELSELLRGVAVFVAGGFAALQRSGSDAARKLLTQMK
jgi:hypothetical protein